MRVDPNISTFVSSGMQSSRQLLNTSVQQLSSGLRVATPSDDPYAATADVRSLANSASVDRFTQNSEAVSSRLQMADSVMSQVVRELTRAVSLSAQGATGTVNSADRASIADQVQSILEQVVSEANQKFAGANLFAGSSAVAAAFVPDNTSSTGYTYTGAASSSQVPIGEALSVPGDIAGDAVFDSSGASVLGSLSQLVSALRTGTTAEIGAAGAAVSNAIAHVSQTRVYYSGVSNQISSNESYLSRESVSLTSQQQALTGVDTTSAIEQMTEEQTAHSAILAAAAKILPLSLLNYLGTGN